MRKIIFKAELFCLFICFQGALEELREELQVYRTKKISSLCFVCLCTKFYFFYSTQIVIFLNQPSVIRNNADSIIIGLGDPTRIL